MPKIDGVTFLKKILQYKPKPVIVISTIAQEGSKIRQQVKSIGAVDVIDKEALSLYRDLKKTTSILAGKIKMASSLYLKGKAAEEENL